MRTQTNILALFRLNGRTVHRTSAEIAERLGMPRGEITAALKRMGASGLVEREKPNGRDGSIYSLTERGRAVLEGVA